MFDPLLQQLVEGFVEEAKEIVERITRNVLELEKAHAKPAFDELARGLHTLKGSAATLGLAELADLAHHLEDALLPLRDKAEPLAAPLASALLRSLDLWLSHLRMTAAGAQPPDLKPAYGLIAQKALPAEEPAPQTIGETSWRVSTAQVTGLLQDVERLRELRLRIERRELSEDVGEIIASLEEGLKAISTMPVRTVLEPLRRAVRDLTAAQGKLARLDVVGAEVSLDRRVLEQLKSPLVHLVRNAVDHGLETPDLREQAGKHREGALTIRVEQQGNMLFLEVADDGAGIDLDRVREVAQERNVATADELSRMGPQQLLQLIFRAGFSTRSEVTDVSGRGVGLDVVQSQLRVLGGMVEVQSSKGQGTRFILTLPAELGSSPVLVVRCGEHVLGVPMMTVESSRAARTAELRVGRARVQLEHGQQLLDVQDLGALLGLRSFEPPVQGQPLLILHAHGQRLALAVDEVVADRELVVRPLPPELRSLPAWLGAATLARGELILILRPEWLVGGERRPELQQARRALVVDDSLTARALHRTALESGGWLVHTAASGRAALEQLRHNSYEVMICDIGMEEMDGLELTRSLRAQEDFRALPILLVSARDSDEDRAAGAAAGADGFLTKKDCVSGRLLAEVSALVARRRSAT